MDKARAWAEFRSALELFKAMGFKLDPVRMFTDDGAVVVATTMKAVVMMGTEWYCAVDFHDEHEFSVAIDTPERSSAGDGTTWRDRNIYSIPDVALHHFRWHLGLPFKSEQGCPDGGACHHKCIEKCWRVKSCAPLSGVFPDNR